MDFPHYRLIPKTYRENLRWRAEVLTEASQDEEFAASLRQMCSEDCLFFLNAFVFTYDPRMTDTPSVPFITYPFQDDAIEELLTAIDVGYDIAWPKSRTMGASWMGIATIEWLWHFRNDLSFALISRNADYVDKKGNPKSLFYKIDFIHRYQPRWLLPMGRALGAKDPNRTMLHLKNAESGSVIDGESTTGDAGRGDRRTAMFIDEHAAFDVADGFKVLRSSRDTTKCRIFNSTPQGSANAFYDVVHKTGARVWRMHWSQHPIYKEGLYITKKDGNGQYRVEHLDEFAGTVMTQRKEWDKPKSFSYPEEYPYIFDGKLRSPWYDAQCARCASNQEIAQELDIDFLGSDYQFFDAEFIQILIAEYCMEPQMTGFLRYDPSTLEPRGFEPNPKGPLHLWFNVSGSGPLLNTLDYFTGKHYGVGSDVSFGTGASNSATSILDLDTGKKVAVWRDPHTAPDDFARETVALAKWFNNGFMIWDAGGGGGRTFSRVVQEEDYPNFYYRKNEERTRSRISDQPGYFMNAEDRAVLLRDYRQKLSTRSFINPSEEGMKECLQFIVTAGGKAEHSAALNSQDPRGAREAHGDEAIADALVSRLLKISKKEDERKEKEPPYMSVAWRLKEEERAQAARDNVDW